MEYDAHGNILKKNDVTTSPYNWMYDRYALTTVPDVSMSWNAVQLQSVRQPFTQEAEHYPFKRVKWLKEGANEVHFTYGPDMQRVKAEYNPGGLPGQKERYYSGGYEVTEENGNVTKVNYITAGDELIGIVYDHNGTVDFRFVATDYLGSITHLLDDKGIVNNGVIEERSYDAWGRPRKPTNWTYFGPGIAPGWTIDRGYTGHEHIFTNGTFDNSVINMNGRLYDPLIGRMFSPDPYVVDETSSESYNKYSYVNNNPLKYTDPSGEILQAAVPFIVAGLVGAGTNVASNWHKIAQNPWSAFGYAAVGATAGAMALVNPVGAGLVLSGGNVMADIAFGTMPDMSSTHAKVEYGLGMVMDFVGAKAATGAAKTIGKGFHKYGKSWLVSARTVADPETALGFAVEVTAKKVYNFGGTFAARASRVFWSGDGAMDAAKNYAKATGGTTLEMTRAGQNLQELIATRNIPWSEARPMWERLSTVYAKGAKGPVHFFPGTKINPESIWLNVEKPILTNNGIKIITH
jgi:RHS repeat-associated protein